MIKKLLIGTSCVALLAACSPLESLSSEEPVLRSSRNASKSSQLPPAKAKWEGFFNKEVAVVEDEPKEETPIKPTDQEEEPSEPVTGEPDTPPEEEAIPVVANPTAINVMVNKFWALPEGYRPSDLIRPNVPFSFGNENSDRSKLRMEAAESLEMMFAGALQEGIELYARSGFRSYETQESIFKNEIATYGYEQAVLYVARPGTSEHQTGLTMDITAKSVGLELVESFENTAEGKWLASNAHHYGFILRYPKGKTNITGYAFEPWHYRYVGVDIATDIFNRGITLEEYMGDVREF
jgi:D-alanyl-D-alanine carboxypeptidase